MMTTSRAHGSSASAVLALSKAAWKPGCSLSKLDQDTIIVDSSVKKLAGEVKSLSNESDLVYSDLEDIVSKSETGSSAPYDVDGTVWSCLAKQLEEINKTLQELEQFVRSVRGEESSFTGQAQRQRKLDQSKDQIANIRTKICRHTDNLHTTLLLINIVLANIAPNRADRELGKELDKLQEMADKLQRSAEVDPQSRLSHTELTLTQYAHEVIATGIAIYEANLAAESVAGGQGAASSNIRVADWVTTLNSLRRDQRRSVLSDMVSSAPSVFSADETHTIMTSATSPHIAQAAIHEECESGAGEGMDSDDDLDTDLAKAVLETGTKAFDAQEWEEAESILQEATRLLQQLPKQQRLFCDFFGLQYKLAVCAYHTQEPADAEEALMSLVQQPANSDEQRRYIYKAAHLLSHLYIRLGQVDRARSECEKALQARRRLMGKQSDAALESAALIAHIYVLLNNSARAKSYLAMIPEARKDAIIKSVEESLGTKVERPDSSSLRAPSISEDSDLTVRRIQNKLSTTSLALPSEHRRIEAVPRMAPQSSAASFRSSSQFIPSNEVNSNNHHFANAAPPLPTGERREHRPPNQETVLKGGYSAEPGVLRTATSTSRESSDANKIFKAKALSRKEVLEKIGCQPKDGIEEAVCDGNQSAFDSLLNKKKDFWQSRLRKHLRPERVTALHFAALFGEIDMARRLLSTGYNINEVPYGYTSPLTPLKFAIGARKVEMVQFLIAYGAKPSEPDSWSTLAEQVTNRSWLTKTLSDVEKEYVPTRMIAIFRILLEQGWDINAPCDAPGGTVLHQAVTFWTGSYRWDLKVRVSITSFLCECGADPFRANKEGKTPYDLALASGHQELLLVLDRSLKRIEPYIEAVELG